MQKPVLPLAAVAAFAGAFFASRAFQEPALAAEPTPETIAQGQSLYSEHCAACHGANLEGEPNWRDRDEDGYLPAPPHDQSGHTWHHPTAQLLDITKRGTAAVVGGGYESNMPGFSEAMSDAELLSILGFIKSTWPQRIIDRHDELDAAYADQG